MLNSTSGATYVARKAGRLGALLGAAVLWGNCFAAGAASCDSVVSKLLNSPSKDRVRVIVMFQGKPSANDLSALDRIGFDTYRHLDIIDGVAGYVRENRLRSLAELGFVKNVSSDEGVHKTDAFTVGSSEANVAWQKYNVNGSGVGIAILDSGIQTVSDFDNPNGSNGGGLLGGLENQKYRDQNGVDLTGEGLSDYCGHGTHIAGIIAGNGAQSTGSQFTQTFMGIAPSANLINVKVLNKQGSGTVSDVILGLAWCVVNEKLLNIRVANLSLAHPVTESYKIDPLCIACEAAWKLGIVVVCAAGNTGRLYVNPETGANNGGYGTAYASVESPGNDPCVITVGAMKQMDANRADDQVATYSSRGPSLFDFVMKPDIVAPGNQIISTEDTGNSYLANTYASSVRLPLSAYEKGNPAGYSNQYYILSGTSMATPVVCGAAALMLQAQPNLSPDTVKARLMVSADKWTDPLGNADPCTYGAGYLNIPAAMASKLVATASAQSPTLSQDSSGDVLISLTELIFGQGGIWGTGLTSLDQIYGQRAMWGTSNNNISSSRAMWGTGFWSDNAQTSYSTVGGECSGTSFLLGGE